MFRTGVSCFSIILFYFTLLAILEKQVANIPDRGFLFLRNTILLYSLSPYSQTERQTESQIHLLHMGWRNLFSSCAVVLCQFLVLEGNRFWFTYSCIQSTKQLWCFVSFLVVAGKSFWCYVHTQCTIQLCCCVSFLVVAGKSSQNENMFLRKNLIGLVYYDLLADVFNIRPNTLLLCISN